MEKVAILCADALVDAGLISISNMDEAVAVIVEELTVGMLMNKINFGVKMDNVVGKKTEILRNRYGTTPETAKAFAFGFATGQAEKVHLGACQACMFRPDLESFEWYVTEVAEIAKCFGLKVTVLDSRCPETPREIWLHREGVEVGKWVTHETNSEEWHRLRAEVCGIPMSEVDKEYHLRNGYGKKCG